MLVANVRSVDISSRKVGFPDLNSKTRQLILQQSERADRGDRQTRSTAIGAGNGRARSILL
jgi:hypothetical protein